MTVAASRSRCRRAWAAARPCPKPRGPTAAFRIADEHGSTVFYWPDADHAYALTGKLARDEMTALAGRIHARSIAEGVAQWRPRRRLLAP